MLLSIEFKCRWKRFVSVSFNNMFKSFPYLQSPSARSNCRGGQGSFFTVQHDKICNHCTYGKSQYLLIVHPLISELVVAQYEFQQAYNSCLSESCCFFPHIRFLELHFCNIERKFTGMEVKVTPHQRIRVPLHQQPVDYSIYPCIMRTFFPLKKFRKLRCVLYT